MALNPAPQQDHKPHIFHVIPSFAHGGVPIRISQLMNHFGDQARHSLLATDGRYDCKSRLKETLDFTEIPQPVPTGTLPGRLRSYRQLLKKYQPDLLLTYNWGAVEWALAHNIWPLCRHYHLESGFGPEEAAHRLPRRNIFRRLALWNSAGLIVPSHSLVTIARTDWRLPARKIHYIPNGVDCALYGAPPIANSIPGFEKQPDDLVIGTMTPLRPEKNLPRLITAFNHLVTQRPARSFRLVIMGEGQMRGALEQIIRDYNLKNRVFLPGHIDWPDQALGWLDVYALSSDTEQMPNALNQAMAAGLPIVGTDVGDVRFMLAEPNKTFITPVGDDTAFAQALIRMVDDEVLRNRLAHINKAHVQQHFDQKQMFAAYADFWFNRDSKTAG